MNAIVLESNRISLVKGGNGVTIYPLYELSGLSYSCPR